MKRKLILLLALYPIIWAGANPAKVVSLDGSDWTLSFWPQPGEAVMSPLEMKRVERQTIPATVPGNVELDLFAAGLIEDPMTGSNVNKLRVWEGHQWCYTKTFAAPRLDEGQRAWLCFGGIDCLAEVWLNGQHVGSTDNMLVEQTFDVTPLLKRGGRQMLQVILRSSVLEARKHLLGSISIGNFPAEESVYLRKAPHMFGWDIMPRLVSAGLWRDVSLRITNPTNIRDVNYFTARIDGHQALIYVDVQADMPMARFDRTMARLRLERNGRVAFEASQRIYTPAFRFFVNMQDADLWWPRGFGDAALYDATLELVDEATGEVLDRDERRMGIRTVRLERTDLNLPERPGIFRFYVNGEPIFVRGTNWVPLDALHSRDERLVDDAIAMAVDLNCNMLRCWGGNVYESQRFYDLCDEQGLMVWQDFSMGCTMYPQRNDFAEAIEREAVQVVMALRNHPCLVVWAGNNEDDSASHWGMAHFNINPNHDRVSREVLPRVVYEFDPTRPYLPSSPYYSEEAYRHGCDERLMTEAHLWGPRGYYKDAYYAKATNCFVSEIGYHGCPNLESLRRMMSPDAVYPWTGDFQWNDEWLTKSVRRFPGLGNTHERNDLMLNQVRIVFGSVPTQLEDFIFASQSVQAEAMKFFVERWRGRKFAGSDGIIWWNLRDGWPIISDAVTDYYNSKKMAYYYIRNAQRDVCCMVCETGDERRLMVVNDTPNDQSGTVRLTDRATGGLVYEGAFNVKANAAEMIAILPPVEGQGVYLIEYSVGGTMFLNHYLYGKPPYRLEDYKGWMEGIAPV